ncbi:MAG TPA: endolytic transglycosylase MltG [Candidatus Dormibacteraeota bacterium]|nr:endolytic transglycosylase MltG [Candidatus Dormibacteraeota bacterium]
MRRFVTVLVILGLLGFGTSKGLEWWNYNVQTPISTTSQNVPFHIDPGETPTQIGTDLYDLHLIRSTIAFDLYTRITDAGPKFQAGSFTLNTNMTMVQIVSALQHGNVELKKVTLIEGYPLWKEAQIVEGSPLAILADVYLKAASNPTLASTYSFLPPPTANPQFPYEGYLFPDTYLIDPSAGAPGLVKDQLDQFASVFSADLRAQIATATQSRPAETIGAIVILASMVDREANTSTDRGNVCSVYYNRLAINMPLGVDATLLYALGRLSPQPTGTELGMDTPYNTRKHTGLPPSPISNPGKAAILACINPPKTSYLYYFTDTAGTTHFETTQQQFEADKAKYGVSGS